MNALLPALRAVTANPPHGIAAQSFFASTLPAARQALQIILAENLSRTERAALADEIRVMDGEDEEPVSFTE